MCLPEIRVVAPTYDECPSVLDGVLPQLWLAGESLLAVERAVGPYGGTFVLPIKRAVRHAEDLDDGDDGDDGDDVTVTLRVLVV